MTNARRPRGSLQQTILRIMSTGLPMRAVRIHECVIGQGQFVSHSLFFRDLGKLVRAGTILKLNVARSYMLAPAEPRVLLYCEECGGVSEAEAGPAFERIGQLAHERGFRIAQTACEVIGLCAACRASPRSVTR